MYSAQVNYTTTARKLLFIVETLKEFRNILIGQQIKVYTDHKNLTFKIFDTEQLMRWRLIFGEYSHERIYIQGSKNIVAGVLSRLDIVDTPNPVRNNIISVNEYLGSEDEDISHPTNYKSIMQNQQKDKELIKIAQNHKSYFIQNFQGADKKYSLICKKRKIKVPMWYHNT